MRRLEVLLVAASALTIVTSTAVASARPTTRRPCPTPEARRDGDVRRCHDGFFTRFGVSARALQADVRVVDVDGSETYQKDFAARALTVGFDVTLGGTPWPGVLIGGFVGFDQANVFDVRVEERGSADPGFVYRYEPRGIGLERFRLGAALALYPLPTRGLVIDLRPNIGGLEDGEPEELGYATYGAEIGIGYELWLRPNLGMGLALRSDIGRGRSALAVRQGEDYESGWMHATGLALTLTLH